LSVLGTPLCLTTYADLIQFCRVRAREPGTTVIEFANTQVVTMRRHEPAFRGVTHRVDCFVPDGMPLVWCLNARGAGLRDRVYGPTFMRQMLTISPSSESHYLLGGSQDCLDRLQQRLLVWNQGLRLVGRHAGYLKPADSPHIVAEINALSPDFIWIGLGTPRQQQWIDAHRDALHRGVLLSVGFAFDVNAGTKPDAPLWKQRLGLTWLFRMLTEPRRLALRYLRYNTLFVSYLIWDRLRARPAASS
jgi:N-acetylglucosaminyldiphosphoundecaprenol N-acetyl-beta-D-mannosaminyltransferase